MMKKQLLNRIAAAALLASLTASVCACGSASAELPKTDTDADSAAIPQAETETAEQGFVYDYPQDYSGGLFRVLNAGDVYSMHAQLDREAETGEALNDIMYSRCRTFEEMTGVTLEETGKHVDSELAAFARKTVQSGDDAYDIIFVPVRDLNTFVTDGYLYNLVEVGGLQLDQPWWIQAYNDEMILHDELYSAASYAQLMIIDSIWCLYFNETVMQNLDLELPYSVVREGKWTLDKLGEYLKAAASLNGDNEFAKKSTAGNCFYGCSYPDSYGFLIGVGETIIQKSNGKLELTAGTERFFNAMAALANLFTTTDGRFYMNYSGSTGDDDPTSYIGAFENQRSLFMTAEISKTNRLRDKDFSFGICPYPKYDESQEAYYVSSFYGTPCLSIPVTVADPERSAKLSDAFAYLSYDMVLPIFRETTLEQKNLRNEESVEMLSLIMESVIPNLTWVFANATNSFKEALNKQLVSSNSEVASVLEKYRSKMEEAIAAYNLD